MVTFILKNAKSKDNTIIYLTYYYSGERFKYSTGWKIKPDEWNEGKQRARISFAHHQSLNTHLDRLSGLITGIHLRLITEGAEITNDTLRQELNHQLHRKDKGRETFIEFITRFISESRKKQTSITIFKTVLKHLKAFPGAKNFQDITVRWLENYVDYLEGKGYAANYVEKNIQVIKQFLNEATDAGINKYLEYRSRKFRPPGEEVDSVYLSTEELETIYKITLPPYLDRVRDRYLIGAFTGLRFSDFNRISMDNVSDGLISIRQQKTNDPVIIPMHWIVKEIFEKHPGGLPKSISNQKMNDYLKLIGNRSGIKQVVIKRTTKGGVRTEQAFEKWKLITTHTARRSAATNMYLAGIPTLSIMKITGHKTEKSFLKYIRITQQENARLIQSHAYFQRPLPGSSSTDST